MYSMVLMAAIAAGPDAAGADATPPIVVAPAAVSVGCCGGYSYGCCGGYYAGCYGSYASCYGCCGGYSYGCCGGSCHGGRRVGLFHRHKHGCCGGYSYGCGGGYSYGCGGGYSYGCCGGYSYGCCGGYSYGCGGGAYGSYSYPVNPPPAVVVPVETAPVPKTETKPDTKKTTEGASLKFHLPAGAKLIVDGQATAGEGTERQFFTPPLTVGQKFFYDVRAELVVEGKTVVEEKRVIVESGAAINESFSKLIAAAANTTQLAGK